MMKKRLLFLSILFLGVLVSVFVIQKNTEETKAVVGDIVCPAGDVKYEVDHADYEYTDNSATVTIIPGVGEDGKNSASWSVSSGYEITDVCIKIGGLGGGSLKNGLTQGGGPFDYDISHVVITTRAVSPTSTPSPTPSPSPTPTATASPTESPTFTPTPTPTPEESESPTPSPTPTPTATSTTTTSEETSTGGDSVSTTEGQVLGTTTLAETGTFNQDIFAFIFSLGSLLSAFGIRKFSSSRVK